MSGISSSGRCRLGIRWRCINSRSESTVSRRVTLGAGAIRQISRSKKLPMAMRLCEHLGRRRS